MNYINVNLIERNSVGILFLQRIENDILFILN